MPGIISFFFFRSLCFMNRESVRSKWTTAGRTLWCTYGALVLMAAMTDDSIRKTVNMQIRATLCFGHNLHKI